MPPVPSVNPPDEHNRILLQNVHPSDWTNPEPAFCYNLVVIGGGTAGLVTAAGAAGLGAKVALIERELLGGDCLNTGCVPSKAMIRAGRAAFDAGTAGELGISCGKVNVDFGEAMSRMRRVRAEISRHDSAGRFSRELGVDVFLGDARFVSRHEIEVQGKRLRFKKAAICTGSRSSVPPVAGLAEAGYLTSETVFQLTARPGRLGIIGGGPIGCELAQSFARLGSQVIIFETGAQLLPKEDSEAAALVRQALERDGVSIRLRSSIRSVQKQAGGKVITFDAENTRSELAVDEILVAAGRVPNMAGLDLEKAGVESDPRSGVIVNDRLQTANPDVYAAGDVCTLYRFTHAADAMARIVIANALFRARQKFSSLLIPRCTYTDPEVAHVGLLAAEAKSLAGQILTLTVPLQEVDRAVLDAETSGFARIHLKRGTDRILGATIVARHAGEMINEITLAMTRSLGLSSIGKAIHCYPTQAEVVRKLSDQYNRTRLTPFVKRVMNLWMKWQRT